MKIELLMILLYNDLLERFEIGFIYKFDFFLKERFREIV